MLHYSDFKEIYNNGNPIKFSKSGKTGRWVGMMEKINFVAKKDLAPELIKYVTYMPEKQLYVGTDKSGYVEETEA